MHKTANVLNKMPKALQATAKCDRYQIALAETRDAAIKAFDHFLEKYGAKVEAACSCHSMDRDALPAFYDFPAEHWGHLKTINPLRALSRRSACGIDTRRGAARGRPASP